MRSDLTAAGNNGLLIGAVICLIALSAVSSTAQGSRPTNSVYRRVDEFNRQSEKLERDKMNREMKGGNRNPVNSKESQIIQSQIKEDLEGIQLSYNRILVGLQAQKTLDKDYILDVNARVKKHAARLIKNLSFPEPKKDETEEMPEETSGDLNELLLSLCKNIYSFLTNPVFDSPAVLDIEQARKAQADLNKITQLSSRIKENAEPPGNP